MILYTNLAFVKWSPGKSGKASKFWFRQKLRRPQAIKKPLTLGDLNIYYFNVFFWLLLMHPCILNPVHHVQPLYGSAKNRMFLIQPWSFLRRNEKLRAVGVGACVSHTDRIRFIVFEGRELIGKLRAPYAFAASSIPKGITTLGRGVNGT